MVPLDLSPLPRASQSVSFPCERTFLPFRFSPHLTSVASLCIRPNPVPVLWPPPSAWGRRDRGSSCRGGGRQGERAQSTAAVPSERCLDPGPPSSTPLSTSLLCSLLRSGCMAMRAGYRRSLSVPPCNAIPSTNGGVCGEGKRSAAWLAGCTCTRRQTTDAWDGCRAASTPHVRCQSTHTHTRTHTLAQATDTTGRRVRVSPSSRAEGAS